MSPNADPIVETTHGKVRGKLRTTVYDDLFNCFDGIPYAKPPLGELRFKSPQEAEPWEGLLDCTEVAPKSLQYNRYTDQVEGSEDCLYVNIYSKKLQSEKPLPVMVYLFGGGFQTGDASRLTWGPDYFMMKDVVLVTVGYRLGAFGFLSLADSELQIPGNAGLKDQIQALKWIQKNVRFFNGDPENITVFGHSAGSCSVMLLLLSEQSKGLFHKAILMAGYYMHLSKVPNLEYRLAVQAGYKGENTDKKVLEFLCSVPANKLTWFDSWTQEENTAGYFYAFGPTVEPYATDHAILTKQPNELIAHAWSNHIPIMLGTCSFESLIQYPRYSKNPDVYDDLKEHPELLLSIELRSKCDPSMQKTLARNIIKLHLGDKTLDVKNVLDVLYMLSYSTSYHPQHRFLQARLPHTTAATFLYRFDFDSPTFNLYRIKKCGPELRGVSHVDELSYIFYMPISFKLERDSAEFLTIQRMVDMWTAFAAHSNPNTSLLEPTIWKPVERQSPEECLNISDRLTFIDWPEYAKCAAMDGFCRQSGVELY